MFNDTIDKLNVLKRTLDESKVILAEAYGDLVDDEIILEHVQAVYETPGTDMGNFWLSFMEMSDILLQNVHACHVGDLTEYISSTHAMLPELVAYNNHDYGRLLSYVTELC